MSTPAAPLQAPAAPATPAALWAWAWLLPGAVLGWLLLVLAPPAGDTGLLRLAAAVGLPAAGLWLAARAGTRGGAALVLLAGAMVLLSDATLRGRSGEGLDLQSAAKFGLWALGLMLLLWRGGALSRCWRHAPSAGLFLFGLWCLVGAVYSATPLYTLGAALALLGIWVTASTLALALPLRQGLLTISGALLLAMALSLLLWRVEPALALTPMENGRVLRLAGLFGSPNNLGRAAAVTVLLAALLLPHLGRRWGLAYLLLALALGGACLLLSDSRGSTIGLAAGLAVALLGRRHGLALALAALAACALLLVMSSTDLREALMAQVSRSGRLEEVATLTGRTQIWRAVLGLIEQAPWLGHGFASTREVLPAGFQGAFGWTTTSAHNLWLQAWLTTGLVGLLLLLATQAAWLREALRRPLPARDAVVSFVLVIGLVEASALGPSVNLMSFLWCWAVALGLRPRDD